jgi:branched-chain amino acid transport system permease protein
MGDVFAGLAGGLYAFSKGIVDPSTVSISRSIDALMIVLLGGVQSLVGPMVGALTFVGLQDRLATLEFWRLIFGMIIIAICVVMPKGIAGSTRALFVRSRAK